jgi:MFS family permease
MEAAAARAREDALGRTLRMMLAVVPLVTALGLASLYGVGALQKVGQLHDAELRAQDALPLVPLPQLLALGIGSALFAAALAPFALVFGALIHRHERRQTGNGREPGSGRWLVVALLILAAVIAVTPPTTVLFIVVGLFAGWLDLPPRYLVALGFVLVLLVRLGESYIDPDPLPRAAVHTKNGATVRGHVIAVTAEAWHLTPAGHRIRSVPTSEIVTGRIESPRPKRPRAALEYLTGRWFD